MIAFASVPLTHLSSHISALLCVLHTCFSLPMLHLIAHSCYFLPPAGRWGSRCLARQLWGAHSENGESQWWFPGQRWRLCWDRFGRMGRIVGFQECSVHSASLQPTQHPALPGNHYWSPCPQSSLHPGLQSNPAPGSWATSRRGKMAKISHE